MKTVIFYIVYLIFKLKSPESAIPIGAISWVLNTARNKGGLKMKNIIVLCITMIIIIGGCQAMGIQSSILIDTNLDDYELLIITNISFSDELLPLLEHKESYGISTKIVSLDEIYNGVYFQIQGRDNPEKIKYHIKNAIEQWNIRYVMLVGGKNDMPIRYSNIESTSGPSRFITDLYYADIYNQAGDFCDWDSNNNNIFGEMNDTDIIDSVDLYPDICIGRILCDTDSDVSTVVNKIIEYESTDVQSKTWFNDIILCGGDEQTYVLLEFLLPLIHKKTGRIAFEGEYMSKQIALLLNNFNAKQIFASRIIGNKALQLTTENIRNTINEGAGFLLFNTHGFTDRIATHPPFNKNIWLPSSSGYTSDDVLDLRNEEKLPIAIFNACHCGDFDLSLSPIAWEFIKHAEGGSIASLACTTVSDSLPGTLCTESLLGYLTKEFFQQYSNGNEILGEIWKESIWSYLNNEEAFRIGAPDITIGRLTLLKAPCFLNHFVMEEWILLGDPSLKIGGYDQE